MIRLATHADLRRIFEIRDSVGDNRLTDPAAVTMAAARHFIDAGALFVWQEADGLVAGFSAGDTQDGAIMALFVAAGHQGRGIGRALLAKACEALRDAGHREAWLATERGSRAERHYRAAGWNPSGYSANGELIFRKPL